MIPLSEINESAKKYKVPAETIEKDYVICWILSALSKPSKNLIKDNFVLYGGTAIKRMYFENHRFSEDIDLISEHSYTQNELIEHLSCLSYARDAVNIQLDVDKSK